jgi:hypothetical protein
MSQDSHRSGSSPRMLWTCMTPRCEAVGQGFTDEPTFCSLCLSDLTGVYDMSGTSSDLANRCGR